MTPTKFHHKAVEVFAVHFSDREGAIDTEGFPIEFKAEPLMREDGMGQVIALDTFLGPMPVFTITWTDASGKECKREIPHNTVIVARIREYHGAYRGADEGMLYLDFMDYDEFYGKYEEIE